MSDFFESTKIADNENDYRNNLIGAFNAARNANSVSSAWRRTVRRNNVDTVSAANPACRLEWAETVSDVVEDNFHTGQFGHKPELFFVTLIDRDWLTPVHDAINLTRMKRKVQTMTEGRSCLFVIEAGYYSNIQNDLFSENDTKCISWHVHGVMWDLDSGDMRAFVDDINGSAKYKTMIPSRTPAHAVRVRAHGLPAVVGYITKPPANGYRVFCHRKAQEAHERELGIPIDPIYAQRKQPLRPGERVRLFHALKGIDPCDLIIGGGGGRRLTQQIRSRLR